MNTSPATTARTLTIGALAVGASAAMLVAGPSAAAEAPRSPSTVTIQAEGVDLYGTLTSPRDECVDGRTVLVFKQVGKRGGGDDVKFASDTVSIDDEGVGQWSTGNTGTEGKFYAKVRRTSLCKVDLSPTIKAVRND
jgi:hypothetical protein